MEHYRTYIRAELRKLRNRGDAEALLETGACSGESLPSSVEGLVAAVATPGQVDVFVESLSDDQLVRLAVCLSTSRNNNIRHELAPGQTCEYLDVPTQNILLSKAEKGLYKAFARCGYRLDAIAVDREVLEFDADRGNRPGRDVEFATCLAKPEPGRPGTYRVIDGMHRAIQLRRNGAARLPLCVFRPLSR